MTQETKMRNLRATLRFAWCKGERKHAFDFLISLVVYLCLLFTYLGLNDGHSRSCGKQAT